MIAAELRGGTKPSLNEALGWIGSRVDDIYGTSVGRLEDVWIDPGTGVPRWLLVKEGRFGGRTTLVPFEDATAGAGHVWVPYERDVVREAPQIDPGAPLTQQVEAALRSHYAASVPAAISHGDRPESRPEGPQPRSPVRAATGRFATGPVEGGPPETGSPPAIGIDRPAADDPQPRQVPPAPRRHVLRESPHVAGQPPPHLQGAPRSQPPARPAPPVGAPEAAPYSYPRQPPPAEQAQGPQPAPAAEAQGWPPPPSPDPSSGWHGQAADPSPWQAQATDPSAWQAPPVQQPGPQGAPGAASSAPPAQEPLESLAALASSGSGHYVEVELAGALRISGELRSIRIVPRPPSSPGG